MKGNGFEWATGDCLDMEKRLTIHLIDFIPKETKRKLTRKTYEPNATIVFAEKPNEYVYFIIAGIAEAYVPSEDGAFANIYTYKPGSFFGEVEQFYSGRKPVEISAITACMMDRLHKDDFLNWMSTDFEAVKFLIREIAHKLIANSERIEEILHLTVKERLLRCIALHHHRGRLNKITKAQISVEINAPTRSVNRALAECVQQNILEYNNSQIIVSNNKKIRKYLPWFEKELDAI